MKTTTNLNFSWLPKVGDRVPVSFDPKLHREVYRSEHAFHGPAGSLRLRLTITIGADKKQARWKANTTTIERLYYSVAAHLVSSRDAESQHIAGALFRPRDLAEDREWELRGVADTLREFGVYVDVQELVAAIEANFPDLS
jgi:hypothetical protein